MLVLDYDCSRSVVFSRTLKRNLERISTQTLFNHLEAFQQRRGLARAGAWPRSCAVSLDRPSAT
jgi:hypothetical protein